MIFPNDDKNPVRQDELPAAPSTSRVSTFMSPPAPSTHSVRQHTEETVLDPIPASHDIERTPSAKTSSIYQDPFDFRRSVKTDAELVEIRKRKGGKHLEQYHSRQNNVRLFPFLLLVLSAHISLCHTAHPCPAQAYGGTHRGRESRGGC